MDVYGPVVRFPIWLIHVSGEVEGYVKKVDHFRAVGVLKGDAEAVFTE